MSNWDQPTAEKNPLDRWTPNSVFRRVIERDGLKCHWCGRVCDPRKRSSANDFPTADHLIRKADGGKRTMENIVVACRKCNNSRHSPDWTAPNGGRQ